MNDMMPIPAGALFTITTGEYSDYTVHGVFRALQEIRPDLLLGEWLEAHPEQRPPSMFDDTAFLAFVVRKGLVDPVDSFEWHLSSYRRANEMWVTAEQSSGLAEASPQ